MEKKIIISGIMSVFTALTHQYALLLLFVIVAIVFDVITGIIGSMAIGQPLTSEKGKKGFWGKIALIFAFFFGVFLDYFIPYAITSTGITLPFTTAVFGIFIGCFVVLNESISIAENLYKTNPAILPRWIVRLLESAKDQIEKKGDDTSEDKQ